MSIETPRSGVPAPEDSRAPEAAFPQSTPEPDMATSSEVAAENPSDAAPHALSSISPEASADASPKISSDVPANTLSEAAPDGAPRPASGTNGSERIEAENTAFAFKATTPSTTGPTPQTGDVPPRYAESGTREAEAKAKAGNSGQKKVSRHRGPSPSTLLEPGPADRLFQALSWAGLPVLLALTALMCASEIFSVRTLWFSDEVRHADVYMRLLGGDWLTLSLNGIPYPDKPPLYFWFLRALDALPGVDAPMLFFLGTALSSILFTGSTWLLARATGHDRKTAFAAGLLTLGCFFFAGLAHYPRMDLLFASVIILSLICLYRGWIKQSAPLWLTVGFLLAGVATLIKGPLALAFPILSSILFLIWLGTPGRLNARDGLPGFALMLLLLGGWVAALYFQGQSDYLREIFGPQIAGRMVNAWHHAAPWWYYLAALPLVCLPWTFLVLFVNWKRAVLSLPGAWKRRREDSGRGWLWIVAVSGFVLLSALSGKIAIYLLPLLSPLAVLAARALLNLSPGRSRWFFLSAGTVLGLFGLGFLLAEATPWALPWLPESWTTSLPAIVRAYLESVSGLAYVGLVLLATAALLIRFTRRSLPGGALLIASLGTVCLMQPYALFVAPSLDIMLSPRNQAEAIAQYVADGYTPAAYRVYPGIYSYYANKELARQGYVQATGQPEPHDGAAQSAPLTNMPGENTLGENTSAENTSGANTFLRPAISVPDLGDREALDAFLAAHPRMALAMRETDWNKWTDRPADIQVVQRQWIVDQPYVLAVRDGSENTPAEAPDTIPSVIAPLPMAPAEEGVPETLNGADGESGEKPLSPNPVLTPDASAAPAGIIPEQAGQLTPKATAPQADEVTEPAGDSENAPQNAPKLAPDEAVFL